MRRIARLRGTDAFGNGRDIERVVNMGMQRQKDRISRERDLGRKPDITLITRDDLLGPKATKVWWAPYPRVLKRNGAPLLSCVRVPVRHFVRA